MAKSTLLVIMIKIICIYFMGLETLPFTCYTHFDESSIPFYYLLILSDESGRLFYSTSNGYNKWAPDRFLALSAFVGI